MAVSYLDLKLKAFLWSGETSSVYPEAAHAANLTYYRRHGLGSSSYVKELFQVSHASHRAKLYFLHELFYNEARQHDKLL